MQSFRLLKGNSNTVARGNGTLWHGGNGTLWHRGTGTEGQNLWVITSLNRIFVSYRVRALGIPEKSTPYLSNPSCSISAVETMRTRTYCSQWRMCECDTVLDLPLGCVSPSLHKSSLVARWNVPPYTWTTIAPSIHNNDGIQSQVHQGNFELSLRSTLF